MNPRSYVSKLPFVGPIYVKRLKKLDIQTVEDLLLHVPSRYLDFRLMSEIGKVQLGETITIKGQIVSVKNLYTKKAKKIQLAQISDASGQINVVWFNQPYLIRTLTPGSQVSLAGKIDWWNGKKALISPEYEKLLPGKRTVHTGHLIAIYPETAGISSKWLRARINNAFWQTKESINEFLPTSVLKNLSLPELVPSIKAVHFPKNHGVAKLGKKRLAFDELLFLQLANVHRKLEWQKNEPIHRLSFDKKDVAKFAKSLPFELTSSQKRSCQELLKDLKKQVPMNRLLEGDVGSGKTVVATLAAFISFLNGYQTVLMAPTQILAEQHFNTLNQLLQSFKVRICLVTSLGTKADLGRNDIFVGTHALIYKKVSFDKVAVVVIDEQQRFGVKQRGSLIKKAGLKKSAPHVFTMTATPIPRTVALTFYGDLDLSTLDELPKGRKPITTWVVPPQKHDKAYNWIEKQIKKDKMQVFVICPLIEESKKETMQQVKAATSEYERLIKVFPDLNIGLLHGRQKPQIKNKELDKFKKGKIDLLVSTPVVEVGIDVPNATIMVVEAAERFGLAQLHQLRGRVGRGFKKSYCLFFTESKSRKVQSRLNALKKSISGFELAELDLKLRGPGEVFGTRQHGFPELKTASWQDFDLLKKSKEIAEKAIKNPEKYRLLLKKFERKHVVAN